MDEILAWEQRKEMERDTKFIQLGQALSVRSSGGTALEAGKPQVFDDFPKRRFPGARPEGLLPDVDS